MVINQRIRSKLGRMRVNRTVSRAYAKSGYQMNGYRHVYLYHIRKTAGTALNHCFFSLSGEEPAAFYRRLTTSGGDFAIAGDKIFVIWNKELIERGYFHYAASHYPMHEISLPPGTFTITCLRDPVDRMISLYRMYLDLAARDPDDVPPWFLRERHWMGDSFSDFLARLPREMIQQQLYMFSRSFDIDEAIARVASCSHIMVMEEFARGLAQLNTKLDLRLPNVTKVRKSAAAFEPTTAELETLRRMVAAEQYLVRWARARP
jgi:hypothetical protein